MIRFLRTLYTNYKERKVKRQHEAELALIYQEEQNNPQTPRIRPPDIANETKNTVIGKSDPIAIPTTRAPRGNYLGKKENF